MVIRVSVVTNSAACADMSDGEENPFENNEEGNEERFGEEAGGEGEQEVNNSEARTSAGDEADTPDDDDDGNGEHSGPYEMTLASAFTGGNYSGQYVNGRAEGKGKFVFPNGTVYIGEFKNGMFHGDGTLHFQGLGTFKSKWKNGIKLEGTYTFADGLKYQDEWDYCTIEKDRRFYTERVGGLKPSGVSQFCNADPAHYVPQNCYDTADGYFDQRSQRVFDYQTHNEIRPVGATEAEWIKDKCLYQYKCSTKLDPPSRPAEP